MKTIGKIIGCGVATAVVGITTILIMGTVKNKDENLFGEMDDNLLDEFNKFIANKKEDASFEEKDNALMLEFKKFMESKKAEKDKIKIGKNNIYCADDNHIPVEFAYERE